jgi:tRNA (guanosine-2'-O-)-methyltransferase
MGTVFYSKIHYSDKVTSTLLKLKKDLGYRIIGAEIAENAMPVDNYSFPEKCAIVFGTESKGISPEVLKLCDDLVYIPINPLVNSINVAASSAVILREAGKGE